MISKSLLRHILTALGAVLAFLGIGNMTGLINILTTNLDIVWEAVTSIVGVVVMVIGYFKGRKNELKA